MSSSIRVVEFTLNKEHVFNAINEYLRRIQMVRDDEEIRLEPLGNMPLKLFISRQGKQEEVKQYNYSG